MSDLLRTACVAREVARARDLVDFVPALRTGRNAWLLDSALASPRLGRFSFAGADPYLVLTARGSRISLDVRRDVRPDLPSLPSGSAVVTGDPLAQLRACLPPAPRTVDPLLQGLPFIGGAVGCLGHALCEWTEPIRLAPRPDPTIPDLALLLTDRMLALDHARGRVLAVALGFADDDLGAERRARVALDDLLDHVAASSPRAAHRPLAAEPPQLRGASAAQYAARVRAAKTRIEAGDVYQVCLTHRLEADFDAEPWDLYTILRRISPAPFAAYLDLGDAFVLSSSPERFLRVDAAGLVETRPIKGTRRRGDDPPGDEKQRAELLASAKDRAENVMIVDLARNDLGRVCQAGSVAVPELCAVETYATVFQLVSTVTGRLAPGRDAVDLVRAAFPPGSMTGAPKLAALRILDRLEPDARGVYGGALGYFDLRGGIDLSVVIRTLVVSRGRAALHVGGGIVADSDPAAEYEESMDKAAALLAALAQARSHP